MASRWILISVISILLTVTMIMLWFLIPGFPLLIFLVFPPLICWGLQEKEEEPERRPDLAAIGVRYCSQCGKRILEPFESYCPRCGSPIEWEKEQ